MNIIIANFREFGPAKKWPHNIEIFDGEGQAFMQHLSARGWERLHILMYCQDVQAIRGEVEMKKGPPGGFYDGAATSMRQSWENALLFISALLTGSRRIKGARLEGFFQTRDHGYNVPQGLNPRQR